MLTLTSSGEMLSGYEDRHEYGWARRVDPKCHIYSQEWTSEYLITSVSSKAACLICHGSIAPFKEDNIKRHLKTERTNYAPGLSTPSRKTRKSPWIWAPAWLAIRMFSTKQQTLQELSIKVAMQQAFLQWLFGGVRDVLRKVCWHQAAPSYWLHGCWQPDTFV